MNHPSISRQPIVSMIRALTLVTSFLLASLLHSAEPAAAAKPPLKVLLMAGGGYHDYAKLVPHLTNQLARIIKATFDATTSLDRLQDPRFADGYDAIAYYFCFDEAPDIVLDHAMRAVREGKPAIMIHCAVHAFRKSPKIRDWETCCGMRSKVHDPYQPFSVVKLDPNSPITKFFPGEWRTPGDELYQTISIEPDSHPLLRAKSPKDGREHIVAWTCQFGKGRVFATTLGHDMKTATAPEYLRLLANGLAWACDKIEPGGQFKKGYAAAPARP